MRHIRASSCDGEHTSRNQEEEDTNQNPQPNAGDFMGQFLKVIQGFVQQQAQSQAATQATPSPVANTTDKAVERFRQYNPPRFNGCDGPLVAEEWLEELERIFTHINCTDEQKVACAIFQLKDDARQWWKHFYRLLGEEDQKVLSWDIFKKVVMDKYFPLSFKEKKETEFFELKQENMTIEEYERKFNELARFAPHLVDTEDKMISRFRKGLRVDIKGIMASHVINDFGELVKRAEEVATALGTNNPVAKPIDRPTKKKWNDHNQGNGDVQDKRQKFAAHTNTGPSETRPQCQKCGKYHVGECIKGKGVCFYCHEPGHYVHLCPKKWNKTQEEHNKKLGANKGGGKELENRRYARVYTMSHLDKGNE